MTTTELGDDLRAIVATVFALNVRDLLAEPGRLEAVAQIAKVPADRVPAVREALTRANSAGLAS